MISKEEYTKELKKELFDMFLAMDEEKNAKKYVDNIDYDMEYETLKKDLNQNIPYIAAKSQSTNYYYLMYPDY